MKHTIFLLTAIFLVGAGAPASGQAPAPKLNCGQTRFFGNGLVPYCEIREMSLPLGGLFTAKTINGNITVQPWDGPDVLVRAQVLTAAENEWLAAGLAALVTVDTTSGNALGHGPSTDGHQQWSLNFEIYVPPQAAVSLITVNGNISVSDVPGAIGFNTTNGNVTVTGGGGDVQGHGVNGNITVSTDHWQGQTLDVRTVNGNVELIVPKDCSAHVELSTVLGNISTTFQTPSWGRPWGMPWMGRKLSFDLGSGGGLVRASTTLGNIRLTGM